jgi:hypothetical protein
MSYGNGDPGVWRDSMKSWEAAGATHLTLNTMYLGFETPAKHIDAVRLFAETAL